MALSYGHLYVFNWGSEEYLGLGEKLIYKYMEFNTIRMDEITEGEQSFDTIKLLFEI